MFRSTLHVAHISNKRWELTRPLVWEGRWQYIIVRSGFETDFASIPKPILWLLDNAGGNAEAAVLHDAVWRESKRKQPRIDPWHADGTFRVRAAGDGLDGAVKGTHVVRCAGHGHTLPTVRKEGPATLVKALQLLQLLAVLALGIVTALLPTIVAAIGLFAFWIASWIVAAIWWPFERFGLREPTNWPWPSKGRIELRHPPDKDLLLVIDKFADDEQSGDAEGQIRQSPTPTTQAEALERLLDDDSRDLSEKDLDNLGALLDESLMA